MSTLREQQLAFAAYLRDPATQPPPTGVAPPAAALYRRLFRRNIGQLLAGNFPVIRATLDAAEWSSLVDGFCRSHEARTPLFPRIGAEFVEFLDQRPPPAASPWLAELARHEWVELDLRQDDSPLPPHDPQGDLLDGIPACSPWLRLSGYRWPVQRLCSQYRPTEPPALPTWLLARRDAEGRVRFAELSPATARLLELLAEPGPANGRERLRKLVLETGARGDDTEVFDQAHAMLLRLRAQGSVLGTRPPA